ncbi:MAG: hypothetical protein ACR2HR_18300 [Euzebya sp.]
MHQSQRRRLGTTLGVQAAGQSVSDLHRAALVADDDPLAAAAELLDHVKEPALVRRSNVAWTVGLVVSGLAILSGIGQFRGVVSAIGIGVSVVLIGLLLATPCRQRSARADHLGPHCMPTWPSLSSCIRHRATALRCSHSEVV